MFVFGRNVAEEILKSNKKIEKIFIQDNLCNKWCDTTCGWYYGDKIMCKASLDAKVPSGWW